MEMRALSFSGFSSFLCLCRWEQLWCGRSWESLAKQWPGSTVLARWSFVSPLRLSEGVSFERQDLQPPHAPGACRRESIGGPTSDGWTRKPPAANCRGYLGTAVSVVTSPQENPPCCGFWWILVCFHIPPSPADRKYQRFHSLGVRWQPVCIAGEKHVAIHSV